MTTLSVLPSAPPTTAHAWFTENLSELTRRAQTFARRFARGQRDDAVAEILGQIFRYSLSAATRGKLHLLTPFTLVWFFGRGYASGRRLAGTDTQDLLSVTTQQRHGLRIVSFDERRRMRTPEGEYWLPLSEVLADRRVRDPLEACRQDLDYPSILRRHRVSRPARRVFAYLAQTHGSGRQTELARELRVSPPRVTQLKYQLADCLAAEDYGPPATRPERVRPRIVCKTYRRARRDRRGPQGHVRTLRAVPAGGAA